MTRVSQRIWRGAALVRPPLEGAAVLRWTFYLDA